MTVKELIEKLKEMPQNYHVVVLSCYEDCEATVVEENTVKGYRVDGHDDFVAIS